MSSQAFNELIAHSSTFTALRPELQVFLREVTPELIAQEKIATDPFYQYLADIELDNCLQEIAPELLPELQQRIDTFYGQLATMPCLQGRVMQLKAQHIKELTAVFTEELSEFTCNQPCYDNCLLKEFMVEATNLLNKALIQLVFTTLTNDDTNSCNALQFINSIAGLMLLVSHPRTQKLVSSQDKQKQQVFSYIASSQKMSSSNFARCA